MQHFKAFGLASHRSSLTRVLRRPLVPFAVLVIIWAWLFLSTVHLDRGPNGQSFGADFAMFWSAAVVIHHGGNPYDHTLLYRTEQTALAAHGLTIPPPTIAGSIVRVGNPPAFLWSLQPFTRLPFSLATLIWIATTYLLSALGAQLLLRYLGWRKRIVPVAIFLAMPQVAIGQFYGNVSGLVFAAVVSSLALSRRYPLAAGLIASLAWIKPQIGLPFVLLIAIARPRKHRLFLTSFAAATVALFAASVATIGPQTLAWWLQGLSRYSADIGAQPNISSLAGLYVHWAPSGPRLLFELATLAVAALLTARTAWVYRRRDEIPLSALALLWVIWFLATPYAHIQDEIMLALPLLVLLGPDCRNAHRTAHAGVLYLILSSVLLMSWYPDGIQLLWLPLLLLAFLLHSATADGVVTRTLCSHRSFLPIENRLDYP